MSEFADRLTGSWRELRRAARPLRERLAAELGIRLDESQVDALEVIHTLGRARMQELALALRVDASTATRTVDRLVSSGLAERAPHATDGRGTIVGLTSAGQRTLGLVDERRREALLRVFDHFTPAEVEQLVSLLERLVVSVDRELEERSPSVESSDVPR
jgi:DNA-binding MarR family transcriptional regulator